MAEEDGLTSTLDNEQTTILEPIAPQVTVNAFPPSLWGGRWGPWHYCSDIEEVRALEAGPSFQLTTQLTLDNVLRDMAETIAAQMVTKLNRL